MKKKLKRALCLIAAVLIAFFSLLPPINLRAVPIAIPLQVGVKGLDALINVIGGVAVSGAVDLQIGCGQHLCAPCMLGTCLGGLFISEPARNYNIKRQSENNKRIEEAFRQFKKPPKPEHEPEKKMLLPSEMMHTIATWTNQGLMELSLIPVQATTADLSAMLNDVRPFWQNALGMSEAAAAGENYFFCFFAQDFVPMPEELFTPAPNPNLIGFHVATGLPIIRGTPVALLREQAVEEFIFNGIHFYTNRSPSWWNPNLKRIEIMRDGEPTVGTGYMSETEVFGFFILENDLIRGNNTISLGWNPATSTAETAATVRLTVPGLFDSNESLPAHTPGLEVTLAPTNAITDLDALLDKVRQLAGVTSDDEPIVLGLPLIERDNYPWVSDEAWPAFLQYLLTSISLQDLVIEPEKAQELIGNIPNIGTATDNPVVAPTFPDFPELDLSGIMGILNSILNVLRWMGDVLSYLGSTIINGLTAPIDRVRNAIDTARIAIVAPLNGIRDFVSNIHERIIHSSWLEGIWNVLFTMSEAISIRAVLMENIIIDMVNELIATVQNVPDAITNVISQPLNAIRDFTINFSLEGILELLRAIRDAVLGIGRTIIDGLTAPINLVRTAVQAVTEAITDVILAPLIAIRDFTRDIYQTVIDMDLPGLIRGFAEGILPSLEDISGFAENINIAINDFFEWFRERDEPEPDPVLYIPEVETDFKLELIDYFPFSLPRDLYDTVSIMLGQTPAAIGGASTQERNLFEKYMNNEMLTDSEFTQIETFVEAHSLLGNVPRFEINVPLPSFTTGTGSIDYTEGEIIIEIDLANHPTLIAVINWGTFIAFVIGLILITPRLIVI